MKELTVFNLDGVDVIDSREVAKMTGKRHDHLIRDIAGYVRIMENSGTPNFGDSSGELKFQPSDFFIPSTYKSEQNKDCPCYLLTKRGCDMVANKMTGEKGVLFTAAYVTAFEEMRVKILNKQMPRDFLAALRAYVDEVERNTLLAEQIAVKDQQITEMEPKAKYYDVVLQRKDPLCISVIAKDYGKSAAWMNQKLHELGVQYKLNNTWLLYQKHAEQGYTKTKTHTYKDSHRADRAKVHTYWTQKGRLFLYEVLKGDGILPVIERDMKESE